MVCFCKEAFALWQVQMEVQGLFGKLPESRRTTWPVFLEECVATASIVGILVVCTFDGYC